MAVAKALTKRDVPFVWEGVDKKGKKMKGEMLAAGEAVVTAQLRRQGITVLKVRKQRNVGGGKRITEKDVTVFTRQLATMVKSGVPLLQAFDIVAKGHANPSMQRLLSEIKNDVETGSSLHQAFSKHPAQFDTLYCNLVAAGEQAGILDAVMDRLASYKEKILAIKGKIKAAMFYPAAVIVVAFIITTIIMLFVIPSFKDLFKSFGADLPAPTLVIIAVSDAFVAYWYILFAAIGGAVWLLRYLWKRNRNFRNAFDRMVLRIPVFGPVLEKATIARWTRTLSTMFAAGVPLVDALTSVAGAAGNQVYFVATQKVQNEVATGTSLTVAMQNTELFPNMVLQMVAIGEESGALDTMLSKVADFYEREVDDAVASLSSLMEPFIMVILGTLIGGIVIAMYLPIFKLGQVIH